LTRRPWTEAADGLRVAVRVTPHARQNAFAGLVEDADGTPRVSIRLAAPPADGAANRVLVEFLAETLGVPRSGIEILAGQGSRHKLVRVRGATAAALAQHLSDRPEFPGYP
jgi:uncharacterized protein